ncbi:hypothetical protein D3C76_1534420 [compost metagenome]
MVFSTHQLEAAEWTADHVILLHEGKVSMAGPMEEFRSRFGENGLSRAFAHSLREMGSRTGEV